MPESVKAEILAEGAMRAVHTSYKNLRTAMIALTAAVFICVAGNIAAWGVTFRNETADCHDRQERVEATRRLWNGVFDVVEDSGGDDRVLDRLQEVVQRELPPLNC